MRICRSEASYLSDKCLPLWNHDGETQKAHVPPKLPRQRVGYSDKGQSPLRFNFFVYS
jgi:hypothetical protein